MTSRAKAAGFGVLVWLVPFVVAVLVFPLHESSRPLFESIMAVTVTATAVVFGLLYMKQVAGDFVRESIRLGILSDIALELTVGSANSTLDEVSESGGSLAMRAAAKPRIGQVAPGPPNVARAWTCIIQRE